MIKQYYNSLINHFTEYVTDNKLKSIVIGISGGIDSAIVAAMYSNTCKSLGVTMYGAYIHIESNSKEEKERAAAIGAEFCDKYFEVCMTDSFLDVQSVIDADMEDTNESDMARKIRRGNTKARLRMMYLYNLAQATRGMVIDTDNKTEHNLGFWTLHGDVGDYTPLIGLWKTEVYQLSEYVVSILPTASQKQALQACIDAIPTDGLGITSSDVEQLGCQNYNQVDEHLKDIIETTGDNTSVKLEYLEELLVNAEESDSDRINQYISILKRHIASEYKRNNPLHVIPFNL